MFKKTYFILKMFERETRREKILEARNKELRLKEKTKGILNLGGGGSLMNIGGGGGGATGEGGEGGGQNKFGKAAIASVAMPTVGAEAKKDAKRVDHLVKHDPGEGEGEGGDEKKDEKKAAKKDDVEDTEDPIVKAEREFFEIIKQVKINCNSK